MPSQLIHLRGITHRETMENIIHDQLLLRTMQNSRLVKQDSLNVFNEDYILRKYSIQDTILAKI